MGDDRVVRVFSLTSKRELVSTELACRARCAAYSGDGECLAVGLEEFTMDELEDGDEVGLHAESRLCSTRRHSPPPPPPPPPPLPPPLPPSPPSSPPSSLPSPSLYRAR